MSKRDFSADRFLLNWIFFQGKLFRSVIFRPRTLLRDSMEFVSFFNISCWNLWNFMLYTLAVIKYISLLLFREHCINYYYHHHYYFLLITTIIIIYWFRLSTYHSRVTLCLVFSTLNLLLSTLDSWHLLRLCEGKTFISQLFLNPELWSGL